MDIYTHINLVHCPCQPQLTHQLGIVDRHLRRNYNAILLLPYLSTFTVYMHYLENSNISNFYFVLYWLTNEVVESVDECAHCRPLFPF